MKTIELFFIALPYMAFLIAVFLALKAKTYDEIFKWQIWSIVFLLATIADRGMK
jgi:hypothetical protein